MPWTSLTPIIVWAVIFIPMVIFLFRYPIKDRITPLIILLAFIAVQLYFFLTVNWALYIYWIRFFPIIAAFIYVVRYIFGTRLYYIPWFNRKTKLNVIVLVASLVVLVAAMINNLPVMASYSYPMDPPPVKVQYPIRTGMYVVSNGGNGLTALGMNDHFQDWMGNIKTPTIWLGYAIDFVEIRTSGMVADGVMDTDQNKYEIFKQEPVRAPCPGEVVYVEYGHPDVKPYSPPQDLLGNRVVIKCNVSDYYVTVASLKSGYELVQVGEPVSFSSILGYVGVSGTPSVPHLHVHANVGGWDENADPLPIEFEFTYAVRNKLFIPQDAPGPSGPR